MSPRRDEPPGHARLSRSTARPGRSKVLSSLREPIPGLDEDDAIDPSFLARSHVSALQRPYRGRFEDGAVGVEP